MNAQPGRLLYPHIMTCSTAPVLTKAKWADVVALKKRKARSQDAPDFRSPSKSRRTSYGVSVHPTPTKSYVSKAEENELHVDIATVFYTSGIPFRVIENPHMRRVLTRYCPNVKLPTRQSLAASQLDQVYQSEKERLAGILQRQTRLALITDGWSNINRESIVNYVISSPKMRPIMWSSGSTGAEAHTGAYMASEISRIIAEVEAVAGIGKAVSVVSDNAPNMKKAGRLVEARHPNVVFSGCSAHAINLLLKDILRIDLFADVLKKAVKVVTFIRARNILLDRVRAKRRQLPRVAKAGELAVPVSTRWYAQDKSIKSVIRNKSLLKEAFADSELMKHYADKASAKKHQEVERIMQDKRFWADAKIVIRLTKPITRALAIFETDTCSNSMILHEFDRLKSAPEYTIYISGLADPSVQAKILDLIENRWKFISPPSNSTKIAYLLDPSKDTSLFIGLLPARGGVKHYISK
ncbi:hypothetical protein PC128_g18495 [Phytophthora cactorum]|nr:hypothetical protein PC120_g16192 [Phytophthora cactorum]KAG3053219.1 hypothetical protein PC121_g16919 [Phytophthora cactorum]KAG3172523.1 hypothetical protein PC128_g18495 [Phytophthora cactorum]KAG4045026.1 hypothetical protein PC123_g19563 [Phytophthora cactorum]